MRRTSAASVVRTAALIAVGAFVVHQLRYLAGYGHAAGSELSRQGHGYLEAALPVLAGFLLSALAAGLLRAALGRARHLRSEAKPPGADTLRRRAVLFTFAIAAVFCSQESLEGILCAGHPDGLAAFLSHGGWLALPLAALVGALCALLDRGIVTLERVIASRGRGLGRWVPASSSAPPGRRGLVPLAAAPLAFGIARRPPPFLLQRS